MNEKIAYKRILLKLSGESLKGSHAFGIHHEPCLNIAMAIREIRNSGHDIAVVIGGGNIFRGASLKSLEMAQTPADHMGMLATMMNGVALQQALLNIDCPVMLMSAIDCPKIANSYNWHIANENISKGSVLIFVGGTGSPYFTTDTAAALRASELNVDVLLKATKVDGVYNKNPSKHHDAVLYQDLSYDQFLQEKLEVMDGAAINLCMNNKIPILVFNMERLGKEPIAHILYDNHSGTWIRENKRRNP